MKWKICGMRDSHNIREVAQLYPDYMGFIFYPLSPRYVGDRIPEAIGELHSNIIRVGVFVDADFREVRERTESYGLNMVQLHGNESPDVCRSLRKYVRVIKAVGVYGPDDIEAASVRYEGAVDYLLFDTKTPLYGGSGKHFDWELLNTYRGKIGFFLSGGIGMEDVDRIRRFWLWGFGAFDLNCRF